MPLRTDLPPPLSSPPSTVQLRRLLDGLRAMTAGAPPGPPLPPPPLVRRRRWAEPGAPEPSLVRPFVLAALVDQGQRP